MSAEQSSSNPPLGNNNIHNTSSDPQRPASIPRARSPSIQPISKIPHILPHERVFPIQIGTELYKLSGASLSSDAPSYFSQYFLCQIHRAEEAGQDPSSAIKTLYIDRDPDTFRDICLHLQGYHVQPRDSTHFVRLFADAQFYSLPKLTSQLHDESMFMSIGHREFQIPREIFSEPGNRPNFFSLSFAIFFSDASTDEFPGVDKAELIRPPSFLPPSVPNRSAETFDELLRLLRGYPVDVRSEAHRAALLQDCRFYHLKGLEQRLIPHSISFNQVRGKNEIVLRLEDVLRNGVSVLPERVDVAAREEDNFAAWVNYARPFVDGRPAELIVEIGGDCVRLHFNNEDAGGGGGGGEGGVLTRLEFLEEARTRVTKLLEAIASKLRLPPRAQPLGLIKAPGGDSSQPATPANTPLSEDLVKCLLEADTAVTLDGQRYTGHILSESGNDDPEANESVWVPSSAGPSGGFPTRLTASLPMNPPPRKRRRAADGSVVGMDGGLPDEGHWLVRTGQWRLRIQGTRNGRGGVECVLVGVKLDVLSGGHARNEARGFLKG